MCCFFLFAVADDAVRVAVAVAVAVVVVVVVVAVIVVVGGCVGGVGRCWWLVGR